MNQKQSLKKKPASKECSEKNCPNCFNYHGCVHQPNQFWQTVAMIAAFESKHEQQIKDYSFYRK